MTTLVTHERRAPTPVLDTDARPGRAGRAVTRVVVAGWLAGIGAVASAISLNVAGRQSAFSDEGLYLFMGHREIAHIVHGSRVVESPGSYFSGAPWMYPPLAAVADHLGGLLAARVLSLTFILLAGLCVYGATKELYGRRAGLLANAVFLLNGSVLFLSHLATFDAMALLLIALSLLLAVRSGRNHLVISVPVIALVLVAAFFTKYASIVFVPVVALVLAVRGGRRATFIGVRRGVYLVLAFLLGTYFVIQIFSRDIVAGIESTTLSRQPVHPETYGALVALVLLWVGPWLLAAAVSVVGTPRSGWPMKAALLVGSVAAPLAQIRTHEEVSLSKHVAFGMVFAAPLIGDLFRRMLVATRHRAVPTVLATLLIFGWCGVHYSGQFLTSWVGDASLVRTLRVEMRANPTKVVLGEEGSAERYGLRSHLRLGQWADTYSFTYGGLHGQPAYAKAIDESHFGIIYLTLTTANGKWLHQYLSSHATPYILSAKVVRYFRGEAVGDWLIYTPRVSL